MLSTIRWFARYGTSFWRGDLDQRHDSAFALTMLVL
jgi:hypothetical protein